MVAVCSSLVNHVRTTHCDCNRNGKGDGAASELYTRWRPIWGQCLTVEVLPGAEPVLLVLVLLPGAAAECGATLSAGQPRGPRTLTYECRARDADTGAGRAGVATDGPAQCSTFATVAIAGWAIATSGPKKRSLDAVCWTSVGHVMPTRAPGGPAFRQWSRLVPCVRHLRGRTADGPSRHPAIARCRRPTRIKRL